MEVGEIEKCSEGACASVPSFGLKDDKFCDYSSISLLSMIRGGCTNSDLMLAWPFIPTACDGLLFMGDFLCCYLLTPAAASFCESSSTTSLDEVCSTLVGLMCFRL